MLKRILVITLIPLVVHAGSRCYYFRFWDWEQGPKLGYLFNGNSRHTKISSMEYINAHDNTLLLCGTGKWYAL